MPSMPTRLVLAGSVLALGSVGTVSAVHLESAPTPFGTTPGRPLALAPSTPAPPAPSLAPPAMAPTPTPPASGNSSGSARSTDPLPPVSAKDLINLAKGPKRAVTVAVDDLERTASKYGAATDADDSDDSVSDSDSVRRVVVRGPRYDDSDQAGRDFARQVIRQWSERSADTSGPGRADCRTDGGQASWGQRISNPFQAGQAWRGGGSDPGWGWSASQRGGAGDSMGSRDYVGRHRG